MNDENIKKHVLVIAIHKTYSNPPKRDCYLISEPEDHDMPSWRRRFSAYFQIDMKEFCTREMLRLTDLHRWMESRELRHVDIWKHPLDIFETDEFFEFLYDKDQREPRIRILAGT